MSTRRQAMKAAAAFIGSAMASRADAQSRYPASPVRLIVPFPAGGNTDGIARILGQRLGERLKASFVVDNQGGAAGAIAARMVARAEPDGYTLFVAALPQIAILPAMEKVSYNPVTDFAPISNIGSNPFVLLANPKAPTRTLAEFTTYVRQQPGKLAYASAGLGSLAHLSMALFLSRAGLNMIHVPYKGDSPAMSDLISGQILFYFGNLSVAAPQVRAGAINALAISDERRSAQLPDVPTVAESGYPGFRTLTWNGLLAPANTQKHIIDIIASEVRLAVHDEAFAKRLRILGVDPVGDGPGDFQATIARDIPAWAKIIAAEGLQAK